MKRNLTYAILSFIAFSLFAASCKQTLETGTEKEEIPTEQPSMSIEEKFLEFPSEGGKTDIAVTANRNVVANCPDSWCKAVIEDVKDAFTLQKRWLSVSVAPSNESRSTILTLSALDCEDINIEIKQIRVPKSTCELLSLELMRSENGLENIIVFSNNSEIWSAKYLKWIDKESPQMLVPSFTTNGEKVLCGETEVISGKTALDFSKDFTLTVVAENGNKKEYTVSLNCPQVNTELPVLHLKPSGLIAGKSVYVKTDIVLYDRSESATGDGWWNSADKGAVNVRGRGNSTWGLPKKPFRIKFPEKFSPIGLKHAKAKSWVLLSQDMDKSLIRNHLAFEYSRILFNPTEKWHNPNAVLFTPCSKYVNVYFTGPYFDSSKGTTVNMNGDYLGIYQMSDQMEMAKGRIAVDKLTAADGSNPDKISGGYIIEADLHDGNKYSAVKGIKMTYKYPDDKDFDQAQYDYISDYIAKAETALYSEEYKDPVNGWRKWFDEKTLADYIIVKEFVGDMDGYTSTYLYKRRGDDKFYFGPVWDCDKGWDNDKRIPHYEYRPLESLMIKAGFWMPPYVNNDWFWRFWSDETFRTFVNNRWKAKKAELEACTRRVLTELPIEMKKSVKANFTVWNFYYQYSGEAKMPAPTYDEEIDRIKSLSERRSRLLDRLFAE